MTTISDSSFESALRAVLGECMREDGEWLTCSEPADALQAPMYLVSY